MKLSFAVLSSFLAAALAAPQTHHHSHTHTSAKERLGVHADTSANVDYNENWAGAALTSLDSGEYFEAVSSTFTIPDPTIPTDVEATGTSYTVSSWIGIDGYGCDNLWQSGVDGTVDSTGAKSYYAWYEWYPAGTQVFDIGDISAGDVGLHNLLSALPRRRIFSNGDKY